MNKLWQLLLLAVMVVSCGKEKRPTRVEIYVLKSQTVKKEKVEENLCCGYLHYVENAELEDTPLLADNNITGYSPERKTFYVNKDIRKQVEGYGFSTGGRYFAVLVDGKVVYYGRFVLFSSYSYSGLSIIELGFQVGADYVTVDFDSSGSTDSHKLDKRDEKAILLAFGNTGRLR